MKQDTDIAMSAMDGGKQSNENGLKLATIIASIIAVCGIGFGVYGMMQGFKKDGQISDLKVQVEDSNGKVTTLETDEIKVSENSQTVTISDSAIKKQNPVISAVAPKIYELMFNGSLDGRSLKLYVQDGDVVGCHIYTLAGAREKDCSINGITGKIYKVVEIGEGQAALEDSVAFIMEDGSVEYLSLIDALEKDDFNIRGKLKIDGFVVDVISVGVHFEEAPGYGTTIFVLSDGSYIQYETSMLN